MLRWYSASKSYGCKRWPAELIYAPLRVRGSTNWGDFKVKTNFVQFKFRVEYNLLEIDGKKRFSTIRIDLKIQFAPTNIYESLILPKILMQSTTKTKTNMIIALVMNEQLKRESCEI